VQPVNVWDYEEMATERLEPGAYGYYAGGAGSCTSPADVTRDRVGRRPG
jgi:hypothetical protein